MIGLIQRVSCASVTIDGAEVANITVGLLVFLAIEKYDTEDCIDKLLNKIINYRVFEDDNGKMNNSLIDTKGDLLIVSQFTLAANTAKGLRPGFESAAKPDIAEDFYNKFVAKAKCKLSNVQTGQFGADMKVSLINDGPVTFYLSTN